jgi:TetR/AcrR family transcriptional repressor of nem operon
MSTAIRQVRGRREVNVKAVTMRKSKQETARTRKRIVDAAATEFRRRGIVATGLADLMSAAGLTHGGFYRHFDSKDELVAEACAVAMASTGETLASATRGTTKRQRLRTLLATYLSTSHRDKRHGACALAALGSELARADKQTRAAATRGFLELVQLLADQSDELPSELAPEEANKGALVAASTMIGSLLMSRIVTDRKLSEAILRNAEDLIASSLGELKSGAVRP